MWTHIYFHGPHLGAECRQASNSPELSKLISETTSSLRFLAIFRRVKVVLFSTNNVSWLKQKCNRTDLFLYRNSSEIRHRFLIGRAVKVGVAVSHVRRIA